VHAASPGNIARLASSSKTLSDLFSDFSSLDDLRKFLDPNSDAPGIIAGLIHQQGLLHFLGQAPGYSTQTPHMRNCSALSSNCAINARKAFRQSISGKVKRQ
jgi:hypothetical protein